MRRLFPGLFLVTVGIALMALGALLLIIVAIARPLGV